MSKYTMGFIYMITCAATGKVYVGQTTCALKARWATHKSMAKRYCDHRNGLRDDGPGDVCTKLCEAIYEHGIEQFSIELLEEVPDDMLNIAEHDHIEAFDSVNNGYNTQHGNNDLIYMPPPVADPAPVPAKPRHVNTTGRESNYVAQRKHDDELDGLPRFCTYVGAAGMEAVALNYHPVYGYKSFSIKRYGSLAGAKAALLEYIRKLDAGEDATIRPQRAEPELPIGVIRDTRKPTTYVAYRTIGGKQIKKHFSAGTDAENRAAAIAYREQLTNIGKRPTTRRRVGAEQAAVNAAPALAPEDIV